MAKKAVKKSEAEAVSDSGQRQDETTPDNSGDSGRPETGRSVLSADQLAHFRTLLLEKLEEITGDVDHLESGSLKSPRGDAAGDLSSMPIHMADIGSDNYEQEFALGLMSSERKIVREIIAALKRIDNGTYGICEGTGEPIPLPRLNGIPWARYCVQYAEKLEKGMVTPPSRTEASASGFERTADEEESDQPYDDSDNDERE